ncbi:MAG: hypothetical protein OEY14_05280 [Myxococcales bacterium]|nr:hypothetical protein [Myxococcales bacterium]
MSEDSSPAPKSDPKSEVSLSWPIALGVAALGLLLAERAGLQLIPYSEGPARFAWGVLVFALLWGVKRWMFDRR